MRGPTSLRSRLTLLFALGSGALLLLSGGFLYLNLNHQLDNAVDEVLQARADDVAADVNAGSVEIRKDEAFAELVDPTGRVIDASGGIGRRPVLTARELARAQGGRLVLDRSHVPGLGKRARLLARPARTPDGSVSVVLVGASRDAVVRAQARLGVALVFLSPLLIAALAGGGWMVTTAALRPVRQMTDEADAITLAKGGRRLPQPPGDDEIAHLGRTLNDMLDRIEASVARERAFIDDASHELRTPISILRAELELALQRPGEQAEVEQALRSALEEAERLGRLAEDLLVLARWDTGNLPVRRQRLDLRSVAERVVARLGVADGPSLAVSGKATISADPVWTDQILTNLVNNALRHARKQIRVTVTEGTDGFADLVVADDGPGFSSSVLATAFDRFVRGDSVRQRAGGGAGLGLAIVAALAGAHGGTVELGTGSPLRGASVRVRLPVSGPTPPVDRSHLADREHPDMRAG